jgi:hypothetical protein
MKTPLPSVYLKAMASPSSAYTSIPLLSPTTARALCHLLSTQSWYNPQFGITPSRMSPEVAAHLCAWMMTGQWSKADEAMKQMMALPLQSGRCMTMGYRHLRIRGWVSLGTSTPVRLVPSAPKPPPVPVADTTEEAEDEEEVPPPAPSPPPLPRLGDDPYAGTMFDLRGVPPLTDSQVLRLRLAVAAEQEFK